MPIQRVSGCGQIGIVRDAFAHDAPENGWSNGRNIRFRNGYLESTSGHAQIYNPPSVTPYFLLPMTTAAGRNWVYAGLQQIYSVSGTTHTNVSRTFGGNYTATANNDWTGGVLGGLAVLNNPQDDPQFWNGVASGDFAAVTAWPASTKCKAMRVHRNYLFALNVTKSGTAYPHLVKWSSAADPGALPTTWDETDQTKDAGETDLSDDPTPIVDACELGDQLIIYKEGAYYSCQYIGPPFIWRFQKISNKFGLLCRNGVANFPGGHIVLGQGDVYVHNGGEGRSILEGRMREWLFSQMDADYFGRSFVSVNPQSKEAWICFPSAGNTSCNLALVWNWESDTFGVREVPNVTCGADGVVDAAALLSWDADTEAWDDDSTAWDSSEYAQTASRLLLGSADTKIYLTDSGKSFNGTPFMAYAEHMDMTLGDAGVRKMVKSVRPRIDALPGKVINVYIGTRDRLADAVAYAGPYPFTVGTDDKITCRVSGRFHAIKFETSINLKWRMAAYDIEWEALGQR